MDVNDLLELAQMVLLSLAARFDDGFEPRLTLIAAGLVTAHLELAYGKAQKVKAHLTLIGMQGVSNRSFTGLKLKSYLA